MKISDNSAFSKVKPHKPYIINRDLEDNCKICVHKEIQRTVDICSNNARSDNLGF